MSARQIKRRPPPSPSMYCTISREAAAQTKQSPCNFMSRARNAGREDRLECITTNQAAEGGAPHERCWYNLHTFPFGVTNARHPRFILQRQNRAARRDTAPVCGNRVTLHRQGGGGSVRRGRGRGTSFVGRDG